jgi:hypothetical protein
MINGTVNFYRHINIINRGAIGVFFAGWVSRQKGLRESASVCG